MAPASLPDVPVLLYTPEQCATALSMSRSMVYALIRSGKLRASQIRMAPGARPMYRVTPADLTRFVEQLARETHQHRSGVLQMVAREGR